MAWVCQSTSRLPAQIFRARARRSQRQETGFVIAGYVLAKEQRGLTSDYKRFPLPSSPAKGRRRCCLGPKPETRKRKSPAIDWSKEQKRHDQSMAGIQRELARAREKIASRQAIQGLEMGCSRPLAGALRRPEPLKDISNPRLRLARARAKRSGAERRPLTDGKDIPGIHPSVVSPSLRCASLQKTSFLMD